MSGRLGVRELILDQLGTMHNAGETKFSIGDALWLGIAPIGVGVGVWLSDSRMLGVNEMIAGVSLLTGLLFGLLVHVFTLRLRIVDSARYNPSSRVTVLVDELRANVSYACAVSLVFTIVLIVSAVNAGGRATTQGLHPIVSAAIAVLGMHLFVVLLMVIKRLRTAYKLLS